MEQEKITAYLKAAEQDLKDNLIKTLKTSQPQPSALKSKQQLKEELDHQAAKLFEEYKSDVEKGARLLFEKAGEEEASTLEAIFDRLVEGGNASLTWADFEFLEQIGKRELSKDHLLEASTLFRFIIHVNPLYSPAWVGWAISENEQRHQDVVEKIFELGIKLMPGEHYLRIFAAEFYQGQGILDRADEILKESLLDLEKANLQGTATYKEIKRLLKQRK